MTRLAMPKPVFSAHAEVVPRWLWGPPAATCILRARGGSSDEKIPNARAGAYSPRTRR